MSRHLRDGCLAVAVTLLLTRVASATTGNFNDIVAVPEPGTLLLVTVGAGALALWRMSRR